MSNTESLVKNLTSKDENAALRAASEIINTSDFEAFKKLVEKTDFLFDFVKNNVARRLKNSVNSSNYKNLIQFFKVYSPDFDEALISKLTKFADEDLTDEIYSLLEEGTCDEKTYAAKYFSYIPDTIAQDLLEKYAFDENDYLSGNCAIALSVMKDEKIYSEALEKLNSEDEFEKLKAVKFLVAYNKKDALEYIFNTMLSSAFAEHISAELPFLCTFEEMADSGKQDMALITMLVILSGVPEIISLSSIAGYGIYDFIQKLVSEEQTPLTSLVLLKAYKLFEMLNGADEYLFDEDKYTKEEVNTIYTFLNSQSKDFWDKTKSLLGQALNLPEEISAITALRLIKDYNLEQFAKEVAELTKNSPELIRAEAIYTLKGLGKLELVDKDSILAEIENENLKAIISDYFA